MYATDQSHSCCLLISLGGVRGGCGWGVKLRIFFYFNIRLHLYLWKLGFSIRSGYLERLWPAVVC